MIQISKVLKSLNWGSLSKVYEAKKGGKKYALKIMQDCFQNINKIRIRVDRCKQISHENVVKIYESFNFRYNEEDYYIIVMEK